MKIWIDIGHPAQLNFYLNTIKQLAKNNQLLVTVIDRGKLVKIANKELVGIDNCTLHVIGKHLGTKWSTIKDANIIRLLKLVKFYKKHKPEIAVGNSFLHGIVAKLFRKPALMFGDDIGRKLVITLMEKFSTEMHYVKGSLAHRPSKKIKEYNALKEWSYLSPKYFKPKQEVLVDNNLKANDYIFVREVITGTLNYADQSNNLIASVAQNFPKDKKVLFSLEDKSQRNQYPSDWILIKEPVACIHSLIYYSFAMVSSGDSMAREGAMLGVPSIYCGVRDMNANNVMISEGRLFKILPNEISAFLEKIKTTEQLSDKDVFRDELYNKWDDVTDLIINKILKYKK